MRLHDNGLINMPLDNSVLLLSAKMNKSVRDLSAQVIMTNNGKLLRCKQVAEETQKEGASENGG